jgi:antitoxin HicB
MSDTEYRFTVRPLTDDEGGGYLVEFPDLLNCMSDGETIDEAIANGEEAKRRRIAAMKEAVRRIPPPSVEPSEGYSGKWQLRTPESLHRRLAERAKREGVSLNTLAVTLLAEGLAGARPMTTEVPGAPHEGGAVGDRRRQRGGVRNARNQQAWSLSDKDYAPALPAWLASARAFPSDPIHPERERDEIRKQALELIDRLLERRPPAWPPTVADDDGAREALLAAGQLFRLLAGWAVWHELADAARRAGVKLSPTQLWVPAVRERLLPSDGKVILNQLDAILWIFQGCFELSGCEVIRDQIRALLAGDDSIVFRPQRRRPRGNEGYRLWVLRARAVAHVEYFVQQGVRKTKAAEKVAAAYGYSRGDQSAVNVLMWGHKARAPAILGADLIEFFVGTARREAKDLPGLQSFGENQLMEDGKNYQRLIKGLEPTGPDKARSTVLVARSQVRPGHHMEHPIPLAPRRKSPQAP